MRRAICFTLCILLSISLISCKPPQEENSSFTQNNVTVLKDAFPKGTQIKVEKIDCTDEIKTAIAKAESIDVYDINAFLDDKRVQPDGKVEVAFPIPDKYNADKHSVKVYYISDDGKSEEIESSVENGKVIAKLKHFSVYAIALVEVLKFDLAVNAQPAIIDGQKCLISDINVKFEYEPNETWRSFAQRNESKGFSIDKDFYGKKDLVYYTYDGVRYNLVNEINAIELDPDDVIDALRYACMIPHRESIQGEWLYDISYEKIYDSDDGEWFDRSATQILLDTNTMTYKISHLKFKNLEGDSFRYKTKLLKEGTYTSNDGDTLGAVLTLDNGYVITTSRSTYNISKLKIENKTITMRSDLMGSFMATD